MQGYESDKTYNIGIYVRESRDENEENFETIETQKGLLTDFAGKIKGGRIHDVYMDDNVSGAAFERDGLKKMKEDVEKGNINLLLLKDLSRLGRNNAKTLLFLDYLEEYGVRVLTCDGRYDSLRDNDTVGIETWFNERYIKDISRKIRASLRYKIKKGEYIGNAPFGYKKSTGEKNRLFTDEEAADTVRLIFRLYRRGYGYRSIAGILNGKGCGASGGRAWSGTAVRRVLINRVYTGDTVQGISEKISFKSKKTRRLPSESWTVTENTHEAIITKEEFAEVQRLREARKGRAPHKNRLHILSGLMVCGRCGSRMYARMKSGNQTKYICGRYYKYGSKACSGHAVYEDTILAVIKLELLKLLGSSEAVDGFRELAASAGIFESNAGEKLSKLEQQLLQKKKQQEMAYMDRLEGRITEQLFLKISRQLEERISNLKAEAKRISENEKTLSDADMALAGLAAGLEKDGPGNAAVKCLVKRITVYDPEDELSAGHRKLAGYGGGAGEAGLVVVDLKI